MLRTRRTMVVPTAKLVIEKKRKPRAHIEPVVPLEKRLDRFWDAADNLEDFIVKIEAPAVDAVPIKRLGMPDFGVRAKLISKKWTPWSRQTSC